MSIIRRNNLSVASNTYTLEVHINTGGSTRQFIIKKRGITLLDININQSGVYNIEGNEITVTRMGSATDYFSVRPNLTNLKVDDIIIQKGTRVDFAFGPGNVTYHPIFYGTDQSHVITFCK